MANISGLRSEVGYAKIEGHREGRKMALRMLRRAERRDARNLLAEWAEQSAIEEEQDELDRLDAEYEYEWETEYDSEPQDPYRRADAQADSVAQAIRDDALGRLLTLLDEKELARSLGLI